MMADESPRTDGSYYRAALEHALGNRFTGGNSVEPLQNGHEIFPAMLHAIDEAYETIHLVTFVWWTGEITQRFADALSKKARQGVTVRLLVDAFGAKQMDKDQERQMTDAGVELRWFRPLSSWSFWKNDQRTHRKLLICDDSTGFVGGVGIAEEWTGNARGPGEWRETHARVRGPVLTDMTAAFLDNWNEAGDWLWLEPPERPVPESGDVDALCVVSSSSVRWTEAATLVRTLIRISRQRLRIMTAYFNPDEQLERLLIDAAGRDVDVDILTPGSTTDSRLSRLAGHASIERLLRAGVTVRHYERTMLHAKIVIVDDEAVCLGSANFNKRSMGKDEECCIVAVSKSLADRLGERFAADCDDAIRLTVDEWANRGRWTRLKEWFARSIDLQL